MGLNAKDAPGATRPSFQSEPLEPGTYPARLVQIIDYGLQPQSYNGEEKAPCQEVGFVFELVDEFLKDEDGQDMKDKPRWLTWAMTLKNIEQEKAKSTILYKALDPELKYGGDFTKLLAFPCNVTVVQNPGKGKNSGKVFNKITGVSTMRAKDAEKCPPLVNEPQYFDLDTPDLELFNSLAPFIKEKIKANLNYEGSKLKSMLDSGGQPAKDEVATGKEVADSIEDENPF